MIVPQILFNFNKVLLCIVLFLPYLAACTKSTRVFWLPEIAAGVPISLPLSYLNES